MSVKSVVRSTGPCGKIGYLTKKEAKAAARNHRTGQHMRAYRCTDERCVNGLPWHLTTGHTWERAHGSREVPEEVEAVRGEVVDELPAALKWLYGEDT